MDTTEDFSFGFGRKVKRGKKRSGSNKKNTRIFCYKTSFRKNSTLLFIEEPVSIRAIRRTESIKTVISSVSVNLNLIKV